MTLYDLRWDLKKSAASAFALLRIPLVSQSPQKNPVTLGPPCCEEYPTIHKERKWSHCALGCLISEKCLSGHSIQSQLPAKCSQLMIVSDTTWNRKTTSWAFAQNSSQRIVSKQINHCFKPLSFGIGSGEQYKTKPHLTTFNLM